jgi:hypothetical protein
MMTADNGQEMFIDKLMTNIPALSRQITALKNPMARLQFSKSLGLPLEIAQKMAKSTGSEIQQLMLDYKAKTKDEEANKKKQEKAKADQARFDDAFMFLKMKALMPIMDFVNKHYADFFIIAGKLADLFGKMASSVFKIIDQITTKAVPIFSKLIDITSSVFSYISDAVVPPLTELLNGNVFKAIATAFFHNPILSSIATGLGLYMAWSKANALRQQLQQGFMYSFFKRHPGSLPVREAKGPELTDPTTWLDILKGKGKGKGAKGAVGKAEGAIGGIGGKLVSKIPGTGKLMEEGMSIAKIGKASGVLTAILAAADVVHGAATENDRLKQSGQYTEKDAEAQGAVYMKGAAKGLISALTLGIVSADDITVQQGLASKNSKEIRKNASPEWQKKYNQQEKENYLSVVGGSSKASESIGYWNFFGEEADDLEKTNKKLADLHAGKIQLNKWEIKELQIHQERLMYRKQNSWTRERAEEQKRVNMELDQLTWRYDSLTKDEKKRHKILMEKSEQLRKEQMKNTGGIFDGIVTAMAKIGKSFGMEDQMPYIAVRIKNSFTSLGHTIGTGIDDMFDWIAKQLGRISIAGHKLFESSLTEEEYNALGRIQKLEKFKTIGEEGKRSIDKSSYAAIQAEINALKPGSETQKKAMKRFEEYKASINAMDARYIAANKQVIDDNKAKEELAAKQKAKEEADRRASLNFAGATANNTKKIADNTEKKSSGQSQDYITFYLRNQGFMSAIWGDQ